MAHLIHEEQPIFPSSKEIALRIGTLVSGNERGDIIRDAVLVIRENRIASIVPASELTPPQSDSAIDARHLVAIPGFIQTHIHLCQTLFRGLADDLQLLDWLQKKIFPFEAAHNDRSMFHSAMLGIAELIRSGTTTILDMGSVHHEEEIIRAAGESGIRAFLGKAMMDINTLYLKLKESTKDSMASTRALAERWHHSYNGRLMYAAAPRFVLSCTDQLLRDAHEFISSTKGMLFHTHASENKHEIKAVRARCKMENIEFLHELGVLSKRSCLAHCIHLNEEEVSILGKSGSSITHCPSSNMKLGSGIANIPRYQQAGITVSLGADGAPCNNRLDMFQEMRLAALLQKPLHGPTSMPAQKVFRMATVDGARALGLEHEIGSLEVGKKADLVLLDLRSVWNPLMFDHEEHQLFSTIVYSASPENVDSVMIDGTWVYRSREHVALDSGKIIADAKSELQHLLKRAEW